MKTNLFVNENKCIILPLQSWRGIFIIMIFILHICPELVPFFAGGGECISFFIILSGFCLSLSNSIPKCCPKNIVNYSINRIKKFYPLYLLVLSCFFAENVLFVFISKDFSRLFLLFIQFVANILLIQAFVPTHCFSFVLNGPSWYLSATAFLYFIFVPIHSFLKKRSSHIKAIIVTLYIIFFIVHSILKNIDSFWTYYFPPFRSIEFSIGICLGIFFKTHISKKSERWFSVAEIFVVLLFLLNRVIRPYTNVYLTYSNLSSVITVVIASLIVIIFSYSRGIISRLFSNKFMVFLGNISFEIYIVHGLALEMYFLIFRHGSGVLLKTIFVVLFTMLIICIYKIGVKKYKYRKTTSC